MLLWQNCQSSAQQACYLPSLSQYPFIHLGQTAQYVNVALTELPVLCTTSLLPSQPKPVPIYTLRWRGASYSKVPCSRTQHTAHSGFEPTTLGSWVKSLTTKLCMPLLLCLSRDRNKFIGPKIQISLSMFFFSYRKIFNVRSTFMQLFGGIQDAVSSASSSFLRWVMWAGLLACLWSSYMSC